jgi:hypothetical protein
VQGPAAATLVALAKALGLLFLLLILVTCVHPRRTQVSPQVDGLVVDSRGRGIAGAVVERRADEWSDAQRVSTDGAGRFHIAPQTDWWWLHGPGEYVFGLVHCYATLEVTAPGHATRVVDWFEHRELARYTPNGGVCNNVEMQVLVLLDPADARQSR